MNQSPQAPHHKANAEPLVAMDKCRKYRERAAFPGTQKTRHQEWRKFAAGAANALAAIMPMPNQTIMPVAEGAAWNHRPRVHCRKDVH